MLNRNVPPTPRHGPSRLIRIALWSSIVLVVIAGVAFYVASDKAQTRRSSQDAGIVVVINARNCDPDTLTVPAGRTTFQIVNRSDRAVEWEILDGVMVVEERENIAPGFTQGLSARLEPGDYAITCGLLGNPRGVLHVTPSEQSSDRAARPPQRAYIGALAEYRVYLTIEGNELAKRTGQLAQAVNAGDLALARQHYALAHSTYLHMGPVTDMFADLDQEINAQAHDFEQRENDASFVGFHRIEEALFRHNSVAAVPLTAQRLLDDTVALKERIRGLRIPPERMARGAARSLHNRSALLANENAPPDGQVALSDMRATVEGAAQLVNLLRPLLARSGPELLARIDADFAALDSALGDTDQTASGRRAELKALFDALAGDIEEINPQLGLDEQ